MKSPSELRRCSRCKQHKPTTEFYTKTAELNRLSSRCKTCQNHAESQRRAALRQNNEQQDRLMEILRQHGAMPCPELANAAGIPAVHVGQMMKPLTRAGHAVLIRRWGPNGQSLYALPGHSIPERREPMPVDPKVRAAMDAEHNAWFASLAPAIAERAALRNVMRERV